MKSWYASSREVALQYHMLCILGFTAEKHPADAQPCYRYGLVDTLRRLWSHCERGNGNANDPATLYGSSLALSFHLITHWVVVQVLTPENTTNYVVKAPNVATEEYKALAVPTSDGNDLVKWGFFLAKIHPHLVIAFHSFGLQFECAGILDNKVIFGHLRVGSFPGLRLSTL